MMMVRAEIIQAILVTEYTIFNCIVVLLDFKIQSYEMAVVLID